MEVIKLPRATPDDAEAICDIRDRARIETYTNEDLGISSEQVKLNCQGRDGEFVPRRIAYMKELFSKDTGSGPTTLVAKLGDEVVGYVDPVIEQNGRYMIGGMYVSPEAQGKGIGTKLMNEALEMLGRDHDIYLEVISYNQNAINIYEGFGFVKTDAVVPEDDERPDYVTSLPQIEMVLKSDLSSI